VRADPDPSAAELQLPSLASTGHDGGQSSARERHAKAAATSHAAATRQLVEYGYESDGDGHVDAEPSIAVAFDPVRNCYVDPKTGRCYQLTI
jgi:hypothetical protein